MSKREHVRTLRVGDEEDIEIRRRAYQAGMSFGQYIRHRALADAQETKEAAALVAPQATPQTAQAGCDAGGEPAADLSARTAPSPQAAPALVAYKLDLLGEDPLRGGQRSNRR